MAGTHGLSRLPEEQTKGRPTKDKEFMFRDAFRPGDLVPPNTTYWVHHYQHRLPHQAQIRLERFPECSQCGEKVRFEAAAIEKGNDIPLLQRDRDFQGAGQSIGLKAAGQAAGQD